MLLHNDIGICEECAHNLDMDDFKGCAVCALKSEIRRLTVKMRKLRIEITEHLEKVQKMTENANGDYDGKSNSAV